MVIYAALKSTIVLNENMVGSAISRQPNNELNSKSAPGFIPRMSK